MTRECRKTGLPGKFKVWVYQHRILPKILWPLRLYEFANTISDLERRVRRYLRRWSGQQRSMSNITLYGNSCKLTLPLKTIEEIKVLCCSSVSQQTQTSLSVSGVAAGPAGNGEQR